MVFIQADKNRVITYTSTNFAVFVRDGGVRFKKLFRRLFREKGLPILNKT